MFNVRVMAPTDGNKHITYSDVVVCPAWDGGPQSAETGRNLPSGFPMSKFGVDRSDPLKVASGQTSRLTVLRHSLLLELY